MNVLEELWSAEHVKGLHDVPKLLTNASACSVSLLPDRVTDRQAVRNPTADGKTKLPGRRRHSILPLQRLQSDH